MRLFVFFLFALLSNIAEADYIPFAKPTGCLSVEIFPPNGTLLLNCTVTNVTLLFNSGVKLLDMEATASLSSFPPGNSSTLLRYLTSAQPLDHALVDSPIVSPAAVYMKVQANNGTTFWRFPTAAYVFGLANLLVLEFRNLPPDSTVNLFVANRFFTPERGKESLLLYQGWTTYITGPTSHSTSDSASVSHFVLPANYCTELPPGPSPNWWEQTYQDISGQGSTPVSIGGIASTVSTNATLCSAQEGCHWKLVVEAVLDIYAPNSSSINGMSLTVDRITDENGVEYTLEHPFELSFSKSETLVTIPARWVVGHYPIYEAVYGNLPIGNGSGDGFQGDPWGSFFVPYFMLDQVYAEEAERAFDAFRNGKARLSVYRAENESYTPWQLGDPTSVLEVEQQYADAGDVFGGVFEGVFPDESVEYSYWQRGDFASKRWFVSYLTSREGVGCAGNSTRSVTAGCANCNSARFAFAVDARQAYAEYELATNGSTVQWGVSVDARYGGKLTAARVDAHAGKASSWLYPSNVFAAVVSPSERQLDCTTPTLAGILGASFILNDSFVVQLFTPDPETNPVEWAKYWNWQFIPKEFFGSSVDQIGCSARAWFHQSRDLCALPYGSGLQHQISYWLNNKANTTIAHLLDETYYKRLQDSINGPRIRWSNDSAGVELRFSLWETVPLTISATGLEVQQPEPKILSTAWNVSYESGLPISVTLVVTLHNAGAVGGSFLCNVYCNPTGTVFESNSESAEIASNQEWESQRIVMANVSSHYSGMLECIITTSVLDHQLLWNDTKLHDSTSVHIPMISGCFGHVEEGYINHVNTVDNGNWMEYWNRTEDPWRQNVFYMKNIQILFTTAGKENVTAALTLICQGAANITVEQVEQHIFNATVVVSMKNCSEIVCVAQLDLTLEPCWSDLNKTANATVVLGCPPQYCPPDEPEPYLVMPQTMWSELQVNSTVQDNPFRILQSAWTFNSKLMLYETELQFTIKNAGTGDGMLTVALECTSTEIYINNAAFQNVSVSANESFSGAFRIQAQNVVQQVNCSMAAYFAITDNCWHSIGKQWVSPVLLIDNVRPCLQIVGLSTSSGYFISRALYYSLVNVTFESDVDRAVTATITCAIDTSLGALTSEVFAHTRTTMYLHTYFNVGNARSTKCTATVRALASGDRCLAELDFDIQFPVVEVQCSDYVDIQVYHTSTTPINDTTLQLDFFLNIAVNQLLLSPQLQCSTVLIAPTRASRALDNVVSFAIPINGSCHDTPQINCTLMLVPSSLGCPPAMPFNGSIPVACGSLAVECKPINFDTSAKISDGLLLIFNHEKWPLVLDCVGDDHEFNLAHTVVAPLSLVTVTRMGQRHIQSLTCNITAMDNNVLYCEHNKVIAITSTENNCSHILVITGTCFYSQCIGFVDAPAVQLAETICTDSNCDVKLFNGKFVVKCHSKPLAAATCSVRASNTSGCDTWDIRASFAKADQVEPAASYHVQYNNILLLPMIGYGAVVGLLAVLIMRLRPKSCVSCSRSCSINCSACERGFCDNLVCWNWVHSEFWQEGYHEE